MRTSDLLSEVIRQKAAHHQPTKLVVGGVFLAPLCEQYNEISSCLRVRPSSLGGGKVFGLVVEVSREDVLEVR